MPRGSQAAIAGGASPSAGGPGGAVGDDGEWEVQVAPICAECLAWRFRTKGYAGQGHEEAVQGELVAGAGQGHRQRADRMGAWAEGIGMGDWGC